MDRKIAYENSLRSHQRNVKKYNENRINYKFQIGDQVFVKLNNKLNRSKLDEVRKGPFNIKKSDIRTYN